MHARAGHEHAHRPFALLLVATVLAGCTPRPAAATPALTPAQWQAAEAKLAAIQATTAPANTRRIALELHEPRSGRVLSARGAVAVLPPRALRMILLGPGGTTALDLWVDGDAYRFVVPAIDLKKRGDLHGPSEERRGLPVDFLAFWLLHPARGALVSYARATNRERFVLRDGGAMIEITLQADGHVEARRSSWSLGTADGAPGRLVDEETIVADGLGCGRARYHQRSTGLDVSVACESETKGEPPPRALADPDAPVAAGSEP